MKALSSVPTKINPLHMFLILCSGRYFWIMEELPILCPASDPNDPCLNWPHGKLLNYAIPSEVAGKTTTVLTTYDSSIQDEEPTKPGLLHDRPAHTHPAIPHHYFSDDYNNYVT